MGSIIGNIGKCIDSRNIKRINRTSGLDVEGEEGRN